MPLVIYLGWHVFERDGSKLKPSEKAPLTLPMLTKDSEALKQGGSLALETLSEAREPLETWLAQNAEHQVILVWLQPNAYVAACLTHGEKPEGAIKQWQEIAKPALGLFRSYRRQVTMLGAAPGEQLEEIASTKVVDIESFIQPKTAIFPLYKLTAEQIVSNHQPLQQTLAYLNASSEACSFSNQQPSSLSLDILESIQQLESENEKAIAREKKSESAHKAAVEKLKEAEKSITVLTEERDTHSSALTDEKAQHQQTKTSLQSAESKIQTLTKQVEHDHHEQELLTAELHTVQESLEAAERRHKSDEIALKKAYEQRDAHSSALTDEKAQHQQTKTSLQSAESKIQTLTKQVERDHHEQELLTAELHTVQESLEAAERRHKSDEAALKKAYEQRDVHSRALTDEKAQHQQARASLQSAESKIQTLTKQVERDHHEQELLTAQLHTVQESLEAAERRHKSDEAALTKAYQQRDTYRIALTDEKDQHQKTSVSLQRGKEESYKLEKQLDLSRQEYQLLLDQLHSAQENLEAVTLLAKENEGKIDHYERQLKEQQLFLLEEKNKYQNVANTLQDTEKKLQHLQQQYENESKHKKQLKVQLQKVKRGAEQKELQIVKQVSQLRKEKDLLLEQLHSAQESLEKRYFQQKNAQTAEIIRLEEELKAHDLKHQQEMHYLQSVITWLRANAYRHVVVAYRYSKTYKKMLPELVRLLESSEYFDADWYKEQYKDIAEANVNPAEHFIKYGALEGRNPSIHFDTESYLANNNDVAISGQHPLVHYLRYGVFEERITKQESL